MLEPTDLLTDAYAWPLAAVAAAACLLSGVVAVALYVRTRTVKTTLREQNARLTAALNNMTQGLCMFDAQMRLVLCNKKYLDMYNLSRDVAKPGCPLWELLFHRQQQGLLPRDPAKYYEDLLASVRSGTRSTWWIDTGDGRTIYALNEPMSDGGWVSTHEDITERRNAELERDRNQALLQMVIDNVPVTIFVKDAHDLTYLLVNKAGERYHGLPREKMIGKSARDLFPKEWADYIDDLDSDLLRGGVAKFVEEHTIVTPGTGHRIVSTTLVPVPDEHNEPKYLVGVINDLTERRQAEARIAHMASHDPLTDLPNRAAFNACFEATLEKAEQTDASFAVLSADLDQFKEINDVFGHAVGDDLLRAIAKRLGAAVGSALVARVGGDEFMLIVNGDVLPANAAQTAEHVVGALADDFEIDGHRLRVGISVGIAIYPSDGVDATSLVGNADAALYRAKAAGGNSICFFEPAMDHRVRERRALTHDLRSAISKGDLALHYQPQARIDGRIVGFEALARWRHPVLGMVAPDTFIPIAESSGLILSIGEWVLRTACAEAASWPNPLGVAVNLSPVQFRHGDLPSFMHAVLLETGLSPSRLELEVTESVLIDDLPRALAVLRRLKALGVQVAMDDFGTGYSSLSNLQLFSFDKIKIDRAFISNLNTNPQSATIVRAVIGLGSGLGLPVVAEGVETRDQLDFLTEANCPEVQGYLIGRPAPIEAYAETVGFAPAAEMRAATG